MPIDAETVAAAMIDGSDASVGQCSVERTMIDAAQHGDVDLPQMIGLADVLQTDQCHGTTRDTFLPFPDRQSSTRKDRQRPSHRQVPPRPLLQGGRLVVRDRQSQVRRFRDQVLPCDYLFAGLEMGTSTP
jgi:hypothetical protein